MLLWDGIKHFTSVYLFLISVNFTWAKSNCNINF